MTEFEGLVAVVTGGASGIGWATARAFAAAGATVAVLDIKVDSIEQTRGITGFVADVTDRESVSVAIDQVV